METQFMEDTKQLWWVTINYNTYPFDCIEAARAFARYWNVEFD